MIYLFMILMTLIFDTFIWCVDNVYCTSDESNPTPVYVVEGGEAVLQCGFESSRLVWCVYNCGGWNIIAAGGDTTENFKYSVSKNPSTGLYYRLHILNVGVSDLKKYRCERNVNGMIQIFYIELDLLGIYKRVFSSYYISLLCR
jgi:hypothetical protein